MKVFKVTIETVKYLTIHDDSADDLEAWEHCLKEDGSFDTDEIVSELESNGHDDLDTESETLTVVELSEKEAKAFAEAQ